ncbi:MAG: hypothetical protein AB1485_09510 [Candidatus Thermoplasmatota archaeon]
MGRANVAVPINRGLFFHAIAITAVIAAVASSKRRKIYKSADGYASKIMYVGSDRTALLNETAPKYIRNVWASSENLHAIYETMPVITIVMTINPGKVAHPMLNISFAGLIININKNSAVRTAPQPAVSNNFVLL